MRRLCPMWMETSIRLAVDVVTPVLIAILCPSVLALTLLLFRVAFLLVGRRPAVVRALHEKDLLWVVVVLYAAALVMVGGFNFLLGLPVVLLCFAAFVNQDSVFSRKRNRFVHSSVVEKGTLAGWIFYLLLCAGVAMSGVI